MSNRYYCRNCGTEIIMGEKRKGPAYDRPSECPCCCNSGEYLISIPTHETLDQWEKRTCQECPDSMPMWVQWFNSDDWYLVLAGIVKRAAIYSHAIIANSDNKPWKDETNEKVRN